MVSGKQGHMRTISITDYYKWHLTWYNKWERSWWWIDSGCNNRNGDDGGHGNEEVEVLLMVMVVTVIVVTVLWNDLYHLHRFSSVFVRRPGGAQLSIFVPFNERVYLSFDRNQWQLYRYIHWLTLILKLLTDDVNNVTMVPVGGWGAGV